MEIKKIGYTMHVLILVSEKEFCLKAEKASRDSEDKRRK